SDETVPAARQRLDEARAARLVAERLTQSGDGIVQTVVEIDERVRWPQPRSEVLALDDLIGMLEQNREQFQREPLNRDALAALPQFAGCDVEFEETEFHIRWDAPARRHSAR